MQSCPALHHFHCVPSTLMAIIFPLFRQRLVRQVLQLEHSVAAIMTKMDIVTEKLELQESNRTNGKETMGKPSVAKNYVRMFGIQLSFLC